MTDPIIREATEADRDAMVAITAQTYAEHSERQPDVFPGSAEANAKELMEAVFEKSREYPERKIMALVAEQDGTILGHIVMMIAPRKREEDTHDLYAYIYDVSLTESARGGGLGRRLLAEAERLARARGATKMHATVWMGNLASEAIFEALAFEQISREFTKRLAPAIEGPAPEAHPPQSRFQTFMANNLNAMSWFWFFAGIVVYGLFAAR